MKIKNESIIYSRKPLTNKIIKKNKTKGNKLKLKLNNNEIQLKLN